MNPFYRQGRRDAAAKYAALAFSRIPLLKLSVDTVADTDKVKAKRSFRGLPIHLDQPKGSTRSWKNAKGEVYFTAQYPHDYGFFPNVIGTDGDHLDVYVGPHEDAQHAYILEKMKRDGKTFDEHKVFVGFKDPEHIRKEVLTTWRGPEYVGKMHQIPFEELHQHVSAGKMPSGPWDEAATPKKHAALVVPTKVRDSKIEGKGLFAGKDLSKGETVWKFDPTVDKDLTRKQVEASSAQRQKYLDTYASRVGDTFTLAGDDAKYMNHSEHANLKTQHSGEAPMKTTRPVRKGEELTADYREFDDDAREGKLEYVKKAEEKRRDYAPKSGPDHLKIKTVDGTKVRDTIDPDFTMGGNPSRYSYVPQGEMWVEKNLSPKDRVSTVVHEAIEHRLMKNKGMSYEKAHDEANKSDKQVRMLYEKVRQR